MPGAAVTATLLRSGVPMEVVNGQANPPLGRFSFTFNTAFTAN